MHLWSIINNKNRKTKFDQNCNHAPLTSGSVKQLFLEFGINIKNTEFKIKLSKARNILDTRWLPMFFRIQ